MKVAGSVIILTGASAGIGAGTARVLAEAGANILLIARRAERLDGLIQELAHHPGKRIAIAGDIQNESFCKQIPQVALAEFGQIDVLINNAGLGHESAIADIPQADLHTLFTTNLYAPISLIQAVLPTMQAQKRGQIINISSIISTRPMPTMGMYCASKSALNFVSRTLRMELKGSPIVVTTMYPGRTKSEFHDHKLGGKPKQVRGAVEAERVGRAILDGIAKNKQEVYTTTFDWFFTHANRLSPRLTDWIFTQIYG